MEKI
ncbi:hypothetical protein B4U80_01470 [Leptotrombidium deliense]|jgi:hypothetical protein